MEKQIIETWGIHNRINLYPLDSINEEHLADGLSSKERNVGEQFAHMHNVRLMWPKAAAPELLEGIDKIEKENGITKSLLKRSVTTSAKAISTLLLQGLKDRKIKGFKPHAVGFLGYIISHESHHRGQIMLCLKQSGHPIRKSPMELGSESPGKQWLPISFLSALQVVM